MSKPTGVINLCSNALVNRSYAHTIDFKDASEQYAYWRSLVKEGNQLTDYTYIRKSSQCIRVNKSLDELDDINYLFFKSSENSKTYYCFVVDKEYLNEGVTNVYFEVDVLQTRMFEYKVNQSYVLQEHCDRWDANLKPIYSRTEEGLDYGSEYTVEAGYKIQPQSKYHNNTQWYLAICKPGVVPEFSSGQNLTEPDKVGVICPYILYLLPENTDDTAGTEVNNLYYTNSAGEDKMDVAGNVGNFLKVMANSTLGEFVQQIVRLPYLPFEIGESDGKLDLRQSGCKFDITIFNGSSLTSGASFLRFREAPNTLQHTLAEMVWNEGIKDAMPTAEQWAEIKANPYNTERDKRFESKLLCYPYRYNLFTDWKSNPCIIKNEYIGGDKIKVNHTQAISFNSPARYWIEGYKKDPEGRSTSITQLVPEEAPVITDAYYTYMLNNKNQIQATQQNAIINGVTNTIQGAMGGGIIGNLSGGIDPLGAILGGVSAGMTSAVNYQNMIRSENAKQRDLKNLPDSIINPNDSNFTFFDKNEHLSFYRMKICCEFEQLLADTFAMTGYKVQQVKIPNLKTRVRYNYVKTIGANIVGSFNQAELNLIQQIFDNGITFWHYNDVNFKPLDYSLENIETKLL